MNSLKELFKWSSYERLHCFPKKCNCEPMNFGELILQPFAVLTSIPYSLIGFIALNKIKPQQSFHLKFLAWIFVFQGFASAFLHSSFISFSRYMDFGAIFGIFSWICCEVINEKMKRAKFISLWAILTIIPTVLISIYKENFVIVFVLFWAFTMTFLVKHYKSLSQNNYTKKSLLRSLLCLILGGICFLLDSKRHLCFEELHLYGHSLWHILTAIAMYNIFTYFNYHSNKDFA